MYCLANVIGNCCNSSPCQNGGVCNPLASGGYYCSCPAGWTGVNCQTCNFKYVNYILITFSLIILIFQQQLTWTVVILHHAEIMGFVIHYLAVDTIVFVKLDLRVLIVNKVFAFV